MATECPATSSSSLKLRYLRLDSNNGELRQTQSAQLFPGSLENSGQYPGLHPDDLFVGILPQQNHQCVSSCNIQRFPIGLSEGFFNGVPMHEKTRSVTFAPPVVRTLTQGNLKLIKESLLRKLQLIQLGESILTEKIKIPLYFLDICPDRDNADYLSLHGGCAKEFRNTHTLQSVQDIELA